jgi:hypothetical protein
MCPILDALKQSYVEKEKKTKTETKTKKGGDEGGEGGGSDNEGGMRGPEEEMTGAGGGLIGVKTKRDCIIFETNDV